MTHTADTVFWALCLTGWSLFPLFETPEKLAKDLQAVEAPIYADSLFSIAYRCSIRVYFFEPDNSLDAILRSGLLY
jgi:hypothetical protein